MKTKPQGAIGMLGAILDRGEGARRWEHWRPTVSMFQHEDLRIDRFEMICEPKFRKLAEIVIADIKSVSPETHVSPREIQFDDPWDFEEVFGKLHEFARNYPFEPDEEDYLVHITTGSHVQQSGLFLLTESRHFPARLVQTSPPKRKESGDAGRFSVIDLDLSRYDKIATRFEDEAKEARERFLKFATSSNAHWSGNFRDLNAAVYRMATLATGKRIDAFVVSEEIDRLRAGWRPPSTQFGVEEFLPQLFDQEQIKALDLFDRAQLEFVVSVCRNSANLSDAGRKLYSVSREKRKDNNDADRLQKYLLKFDLSWPSATARVLE
jgi:sigma54-dependent transcription regulator